MNSVERIGALAISVMLIACAPTKAPTQAVTVSLQSVACKDGFTSSHARPITLNPKEQTALEVEVSQASPCKLDANGNKQLYEVIALPFTTSPYLVSVSSEKIGGSAFAATAVTLDDTEQVRQAFNHDRFLNRGRKLMLHFEAHPDERFLVISSHADVVGDVRKEISTVISSQSHYNAGFGTTSTLYFGSENVGGYTFSHTGKVVVATTAAPNRALNEPSDDRTARRR